MAVHRNFVSPLHEPAPELLAELANAALRYVKSGQTVGLGSGRAANAFVRALGEAGISVRAVPTSTATAELARSYNIELVDLAAVKRLDADFDGADEVDPRLNMIKGRGGAMVREKVIATASRRRIFLIWDGKLVQQLGERGNLPIEVVPFAAPLVVREIAKLGLKPKIRRDHEGHEVYSDNGNLILDCGVSRMRNPRRLECDLLSIPGVVGTGLFLQMADVVLVLSAGGKISALRRSAQR